jgi:hypothetical protein
MPGTRRFQTLNISLSKIVEFKAVCAFVAAKVLLHAIAQSLA